jgi:hypothetical protein
MRDGLTIVRSFINEVEAELALGRLQAMGIAGVLQKDNCGGMRPHMDLTVGVHLLVAEAEREDALAVLRDEAAADGATPWTCHVCGVDGETGFEVCWQCGSPRL